MGRVFGLWHGHEHLELGVFGQRVVPKGPLDRASVDVEGAKPVVAAVAGRGAARAKAGRSVFGVEGGEGGTLECIGGYWGRVEGRRQCLWITTPLTAGVT